jgi:hypothetical protein
MNRYNLKKRFKSFAKDEEGILQEIDNQNSYVDQNLGNLK